MIKMSKFGQGHEPLKLSELKTQAWKELSSIDGVEGVGVGDQRLRIYVRNADVGRRIRHAYHGVPVEVVVVGHVVAA